MAHINRFFITFGFLLFGLFLWARFPGVIGIIAMVLLGLAGALLGNIVFRKQVNAKRAKDDAENRIDKD